MVSSADTGTPKEQFCALRSDIWPGRSPVTLRACSRGGPRVTCRRPGSTRNRDPRQVRTATSGRTLRNPVYPASDKPARGPGFGPRSNPHGLPDARRPISPTPAFGGLTIAPASRRSASEFHSPAGPLASLEASQRAPQLPSRSPPYYLGAALELVHRLDQQPFRGPRSAPPLVGLDGHLQDRAEDGSLDVERGIEEGLTRVPPGEDR